MRQDFAVLTDQLEQLFIEIDKSVLHVNKNVIVGIIYRPPDKDPVTFIGMVQTVMEKIDKEKKIGYLLGDFNLDLLKSDIHNPTLDFLNLLFSHSFWPLITRPTRVTSSSATLIDNIFTNNIALKISCINGIIINDISYMQRCCHWRGRESHIQKKFHTQSSTIIQLSITGCGLELCFKWIWHKQGLLNVCAYL